MRKLTRQEMTWFALPLLVPICIWAMHFVSHPTHSAHLKAPDLIGTYRAQTSEGTQTLVLEKNGNLQNVLVLNGGYTYRQKTGSWNFSGNQTVSNLLNCVAYFTTGMAIREFMAVAIQLMMSVVGSSFILLMGKYEKQ